jgi:hypothetical protein
VYCEGPSVHLRTQPYGLNRAICSESGVSTRCDRIILRTVPSMSVAGSGLSTTSRFNCAILADLITWGFAFLSAREAQLS